jgi:hypothetical protein
MLPFGLLLSAPFVVGVECSFDGRVAMNMGHQGLPVGVPLYPVSLTSPVSLPTLCPLSVDGHFRSCRGLASRCCWRVFWAGRRDPPDAYHLFSPRVLEHLIGLGMLIHKGHLRRLKSPGAPL